MATANPIPPPSIPVRGQVQRTFVDARVLTGFMDDAHVNQTFGDYLSSLDPLTKSQLDARIAASRTFVKSLPVVPLDGAVRKPLTASYIDQITKDPAFQQAFSQRLFRFAYIRPDRLIALQVHVKPRADKVPSNPDELMAFTLPTKSDVPAELSFVPPSGPIHIFSSNPAMQGVQFELDAAAGSVRLSPPKHFNLVNVIEFAGRFFLRNGYHRVFDCINAGLQEIPAIVVTAIQPGDILIGGQTFNLGVALALPRPPMVTDFATGAAVDAKLRERRYGISIALQLNPFNIGI